MYTTWSIFIVGEEERERPRQRQRDRETERQRETETETERVVPCRIMLCIITKGELLLIKVSKTIMSHYGKLYLSYVAHVYDGKLVSLIGNQRVGIFPPKSKILFYLSL